MKRSIHYIRWGGLLLITALGMAACAAVQPVPQAGEAQIEAAQVPEVEESAASADGLPMPSAPATADAFRADSVSLVAATGKPQLIEFFAFWCTVCRQMRPIVHKLEAEYWDRIDFVYLDIDDTANQSAMDQYGYIAQPYFVLVDSEGNVAEQWYGSRSEADLRASLEALLGQGG